MQFEKIFEGKADCAETFTLINRGYTPDVFKAGQWFEIDQSEYWYFLEVLPPMDFYGQAFSMCEFSTDDLTNMFVSVGSGDNEKYYLVTIQRKNAADFKSALSGFLNVLSEEVA
jgi:hypothetical protein